MAVLYRSLELREGLLGTTSESHRDRNTSVSDTGLKFLAFLFLFPECWDYRYVFSLGASVWRSFAFKGNMEMDWYLERHMRTGRIPKQLSPSSFLFFLSFVLFLF